MNKNAKRWLAVLMAVAIVIAMSVVVMDGRKLKAGEDDGTITAVEMQQNVEVSSAPVTVVLENKLAEKPEETPVIEEEIAPQGEEAVVLAAAAPVENEAVENQEEAAESEVPAEALEAEPAEPVVEAEPETEGTDVTVTENAATEEKAAEEGTVPEEVTVIEEKATEEATVAEEKAAEEVTVTDEQATEETAEELPQENEEQTEVSNEVEPLIVEVYVVDPKDVYYVGDIIRLEAKIIGEATDPVYRWQVLTGEGAQWKDIPGANLPYYEYAVDFDSVGYSYRVLVTNHPQTAVQTEQSTVEQGAAE